MLRSMTGFGRAERECGSFRLTIDLKTVNHRYAEAAIRLPREWIRFEEPLRKQLLAVIRRGRADAVVGIERVSGAQAPTAINLELASAYVDAASQLKQLYGLEGSLTVSQLMALPDLLQLSAPDMPPDEKLSSELAACLTEALDQLERMRRTEGGFLEADMLQRLERLEQLRSELEFEAPAASLEYRTRLQGRMADLLQGHPIDEARILTEVAVFAENASIDEELTRLRSHFAQFHSLLSAEEPVGRKLDFLIQEMNREANTIGSKSKHVELTTRVVEMKAELEKIREQVQNIE